MYLAFVLIVFSLKTISTKLSYWQFGMFVLLRTNTIYYSSNTENLSVFILFCTFDVVCTEQTATLKRLIISRISTSVQFQAKNRYISG